MTNLLTAAQMRHLEQTAITSGRVTGLDLMERAGQGVVEAIFEHWPDFSKTGHRAVVLCGPGNNGGDGFVVARLLQVWGWQVNVFFYGQKEKLPPDARKNFEKWTKSNRIERLNFPTLTKANARSLTDAIYSISQTDIVIDALFGLGLQRPLDGLAPFLETQDLYATFDDLMPARTVSIDLPSGLDSDSGRVLHLKDHPNMPWSAVQADLTVTFQTAKPAHFLAQGPAHCGTVAIKDIGLGLFLAQISAPQASTPTAHAAPCQLNGHPDARLLSKSPYAHKFSNGHAIVASGPATKTGAARLAARGALRIGAGLVTVASPSDALSENAADLTAILLREVTSADAFETILSDDRISSICIGPGFAPMDAGGALNFTYTRQMVKTALRTGKKIVLDADALSAFQDNPADLFKHLHAGCVLTPHAGEFERLFPDLHNSLSAPVTVGPAYSKVDATRDAAHRAGCTVLFKGPDTVIADQQGRATINTAHHDRAAPWLATAGSGDVLAGFIAGLLARGMAPMPAAQAAAWLHVECARSFGAGLIAEDLPEELPRVLAGLPAR